MFYKKRYYSGNISVVACVLPALPNSIFVPGPPPRPRGRRILGDESVEVPGVVLGALNRLAVPVERFLDERSDALVTVLLGTLKQKARLRENGDMV